jgi:transposase
VRQARLELAAELTADLRRIDAQLRVTRNKLAAAIRACGSTVTRVFGVGPVIAATVIGDVRDVSRFASRDCFAAYDGTAPIEVSSGNRRVHRLSRRGNRRLNHAIHMAAITQIRCRHSEGRAYYDKKLLRQETTTTRNYYDKKLRSVRDFARKEWPLRGSPADVRCHRVLRSAGG